MGDVEQAVASEAGGAGEPALRLAVVQTSPALGEVAANLAAAIATLRGLAGQSEFAVFPELFTTGYNREELDHVGLAEPIPDGPTVTALCSAAAETGVGVVGTILERSGDTVYDTAIVIDSAGRFVTSYRKSHLYPAERALFGAGDRVVVARLSERIRLGLAICFEHAFPEIFAELALAGANVIAIPSAVPEGYEYLLDLRTRARAQDNQVYVAAANLSGFDGRTRWCGGSLIAGPRGDVLAVAGPDQGVIGARIDLSRIESERRQEPIFVNRRPELYSRLRAVAAGVGGVPLPADARFAGAAKDPDLPGSQD